MIGIDIVSIARMEAFINKFGTKALERFLSSSEIALIKTPKNAAGFWAAKEAASKALGTGIGSECSFHDIIISKNPKGAPQITFSKKITDTFHIQKASLSITHDGEYALAAVIIL